MRLSERGIGPINLGLIVILGIIALFVFLFAAVYIVAILAILAGFGIAYISPGNKLALGGGISIIIVGLILAILAYTSHGLLL